MSARTVMLIEDEKKMSKLYGVVLETRGYSVISVDSVDDALTLMDQALPDIIISDIMMPVTNGVEGCKIIRERHGRDVPILFVSCTLNKAYNNSLNITSLILKIFFVPFLTKRHHI